MVSVLIVNWNTRDLLRACLQSIAAHCASTPHEVIVVDNASADGSAAMVAAEFPEVLLIASSRNTGYAAGNNLAAAQARGDYLLTLNPDTEFVDDALASASRALAARPSAGALGARLLNPDGSAQRSVRGFPSILGVLGAVTGLDRVARGPLGSYFLRDFDYETPGPAAQPMGTFLLFRREALASAGDPRRPFDESFPIFFNEVDLLYRMHLAGWPCWYDPSVRVLHHGGQSTRQVRKAMIWESHRSLVRYLNRHTRGLARAGLPLAALIAYAGAFVRAKGYDAGFRVERHDL
jgi:GT2 family glycosyltransferase